MENRIINRGGLSFIPANRKLKNRLDKKPKVKRKQNDHYVVVQQDNRGVVGTDEMVDGVAHPGDTVFGNF